MDFVQPLDLLIPGAQGRLLSALAGTSLPVNLRTLAQISDVSPAQASRLLPGLVSAGVVTRQDVPPSAVFALERRHVAAGPILALADARRTALDAMRAVAETLDPQPVSTVVFGSFARGEADEASDIDTVLVRPRHLDEDDARWADVVERWQAEVGVLTGNRVDVLEVAADAVGGRLCGEGPVWQDIRGEGVVVQGATLDDLALD